VTLVLSCIAPEYAVQVSDRCLTDLRTGIAVEQEANKAVVLSNRVAFAYTGLARIEGKPTDIWLRDALVVQARERAVAREAHVGLNAPQRAPCERRPQRLPRGVRAVGAPAAVRDQRRLHRRGIAAHHASRRVK
jgi:hypothetical protein